MKRIFLLIFLFFFLCSCNKTQETEIDSIFNFPLRKEMDSLPIGNQKYQMEVINKYLKIAEKGNYKDGKAHCYIDIANVNINQGKFNEALIVLNKAEAFLKNSDNIPLKAYMYNVYALLCYRVNLNDKSFALMYNDKALHYMEEIATDKYNIYHLDNIYQVRSDFFSTNQHQDSAIYYLNKARNNPSSLIYYIRTTTSLAELKMYHFEPGSATIYINEALEKIKKIKTETRTHLYTYMVAGCYYMKVGKYHEAVEFLHKALEINDEIPDNHYSPFLYAYLQELYQKIGNKEKELYFMSLASKAKEKMFEQRDLALNLVNKKLISDTKQSKAAKISIIWLCFAFFIMVALAVSMYIYIKIKKLKAEKNMPEVQPEIFQSPLGVQQTKELIELARNNDSFFLARFKEEYPIFISKLLKINPNLENSEIIFCAMLKLGFTSKELAQNLVIQHTSVQKRKNRIRKRLNIQSDIDIYDFFDRLG
ncbi:tetratricopeptide repeat protein [Chryseobacterium sp. c4a]|uniref:tetratricopeptide repeat protein n=1 Tax=Chryseobacterium sp. c4a TaxID=1573582 RepID=UPI00135A26E9|nr:tetratricopeptide repeat protein [Chryseobacterium sp. c4a]